MIIHTKRHMSGFMAYGEKSGRVVFMDLPVRRLRLEIEFLENKLLEQVLITYRHDKSKNDIVGSRIDIVGTRELEEVKNTTFWVYAAGTRVPRQVPQKRNPIG